MKKMYVFTDATNCIRRGPRKPWKGKSLYPWSISYLCRLYAWARQSIAEVKSAIAEDAIAEIENGESDYVSFLPEIGCELFTIDID